DSLVVVHRTDDAARIDLTSRDFGRGLRRLCGGGGLRSGGSFLGSRTVLAEQCPYGAATNEQYEHEERNERPGPTAALLLLWFVWRFLRRTVHIVRSTHDLCAGKSRRGSIAARYVRHHHRRCRI